MYAYTLQNPLETEASHLRERLISLGEYPAKVYCRVCRKEIITRIAAKFGPITLVMMLLPIFKSVLALP